MKVHFAIPFLGTIIIVSILAGAFLGYWMPMFFSLGATILRHCTGA